MAQAISNKILVKDYKYCWMICDYTLSGSTMTYTLSFHWDGGDAQLDNAWIKVGGTTVWQNAGRIHNYDPSQDNRGSYDLTIHNGTATVSGTQTVTFGITKYQNNNMSGSFSATGGTAPSGGYATYHSSTWNSITFTTGVTNTGGTTIQNHAAVVTGSSNGEVDNTSNWDIGRHEYKYDGYSASSHKFENCKTSNATETWLSPIAIKGLLHYKLGWWIGNNAGFTSGLNNTLRYLPPSPLQSIAYTQTAQSTNVKVNLTITGGNSTNNYSDTVTTYYRYSTNGGSSYSSWTSAGTGTPWTAKTASFTCAYKSNVVVQAKQTYHSMDSEVKSISFTASSGTAPSGGSLSVSSSTWNSVTLVASGVNYGDPSSVSGRKISVGVSSSSSALTYKRENQLENVTSATTTVTNNSVYPSASALQLKGMLAVYPYLWAWNTVSSSTLIHQSSPYYLPPAPGIGSYTDQGSGDYYITYTGNTANNVGDYTASELKRTVRYKIDSGAWVYVNNNVQKALTDVTTQTITIPYQSTATIEAWDTYRGKDSVKTTFTITNVVRPVHFYGSVNGVTEEIEHLYGSVGGQSVKITKLYASVGGVAKEVFEDV